MLYCNLTVCIKMQLLKQALPMKINQMFLDIPVNVLHILQIFGFRQDGEDDSLGSCYANFANIQTGATLCWAPVTLLHFATGNNQNQLLLLLFFNCPRWGIYFHN